MPLSFSASMTRWNPSVRSEVLAVAVEVVRVVLIGETPSDPLMVARENSFTNFDLKRSGSRHPFRVIIAPLPGEVDGGDHAPPRRRSGRAGRPGRSGKSSCSWWTG